MASPSTPVHPARYLTVFLILLIGVYLLVFLTGSKRADAKLGIDLQGGTRVTLTARTPDGSRPTRQALSQAQQIISARVNGLGVSGSEVIVDGDNLVITVPGKDSSEARNLGQTARLYIRPVINALPAESGPLPQGPQRLPAPHRATEAAAWTTPGRTRTWRTRTWWPRTPGGPAPGRPLAAVRPQVQCIPGHGPGGLPMPGDLPLPARAGAGGAAAALSLGSTAYTGTAHAGTGTARRSGAPAGPARAA